MDVFERSDVQVAVADILDVSRRMIRGVHLTVQHILFWRKILVWKMFEKDVKMNKKK